MRCLLYFTVLSAMSACMTADAKTVLWYRFGESPCGTVTGEGSTVVNHADPDSLPGLPKVLTAKCTTGTSPADMMPMYTNAFPSAVKVYDPVSGEVYDNDTSLYFETKDNRHVPGSAVVIEDDEKLHLHRQTIEFFMRMPDFTSDDVKVWQNLISRDCYDEYKTLTYGIRCSGYGIMCLYYGFAQYDDNGTVTNIAERTVSQNLGNFPKDDRWWHIAVTFDSDEKKASLYVNYALQATGDYDGVLYYDESDSPLVIGSQITEGYGLYRGSIDEVRISDEVLAPEEFLRARPVAGRAGAARDDTLVYVDFEGSAEESVFGMFKADVSFIPAIANKAIWNPAYHPVPEIVTTAKSLDPRFVQTNDVAAARIRPGLAGAAGDDNASSFYFSTNGVSGTRPTCLLVPDENDEIFSDDSTVEFSFRIPPGQIHSLGWSAAYLSTRDGRYEITMANNGGYLSGKVGGVPFHFPRGRGNGFAHTLESYSDDEWHHVALVYRKDEAKLELYLDSELRSTMSDVTFSETQPAKYSQGLFFGGAHYSDDQHRFCHLTIDNVRISRGALKPFQFLHRGAAESAYLARACFDSGYGMDVYSGSFDAPVASAPASGGSAPSVVRRHPGRKVTEGTEGDYVNGRNHGSLALDGGKVVYPGFGTVCDASEFTVEFFMKADTAIAGADIMRVNRTSENETGDPLWAISFGDAEGNVSVALDTDTVSGTVRDFDACFADGAWHHVALTVAREGASSVVTLYRDYADVGSFSVPGRTETAFDAMNFTIGDGTAGFTGFIDELRVSVGALTPERFMRAVRQGSVISVR